MPPRTGNKCKECTELFVCHAYWLHCQLKLSAWKVYRLSRFLTFSITTRVGNCLDVRMNAWSLLSWLPAWLQQHAWYVQCESTFCSLPWRDAFWGSGWRLPPVHAELRIMFVFFIHLFSGPLPRHDPQMYFLWSDKMASCMWMVSPCIDDILYRWLCSS